MYNIYVQCKTYLNTDLVLITMLECLLVESDMFSIFPIMDWQINDHLILIVSSKILI